MNGLLVVLKPSGMTSHDVVEFVRRLTGVKVGHTGTLDPAAAGVLVLCLGQATRLAELLAQDAKTYRAEITLGISTDTLDAEGQITNRADASAVSRELMAEVLADLVGEIEMPVPVFSAVKRGGQKLYEAARRGEDVEAPMRLMQIDNCELLEFEAAEVSKALVEIHCSKGTYVRSIAALIGEKLGCGAHLSFLLRTAVGRWGLADALTLEEVEELAAEGRLQGCLISCADALPHLPLFGLGWGLVNALRHGTAQYVGGAIFPSHTLLRVIDPQGELVCLAEACPDLGAYLITPKKVLAH